MALLAFFRSMRILPFCLLLPLGLFFIFPSYGEGGDCGGVLSNDDFKSLLSTEEWNAWGKDYNVRWEEGLKGFFCGKRGSPPTPQESDLLSWFTRPYQGLPDPSEKFPQWVSTSVSINATLQFATDGWVEQGSYRNNALEAVRNFLTTHYSDSLKTHEVPFGSPGCLPPLAEICAKERAYAILYHGGATETAMSEFGKAVGNISQGKIGEGLKNLGSSFVYGIRDLVSANTRICEDTNLAAGNTAKLTLQFLADLKRNSRFVSAAMQAAIRASSSLGLPRDVPALKPPPREDTVTDRLSGRDIVDILSPFGIPRDLSRYPLLWIYTDNDTDESRYNYQCEDRHTRSYSRTLDFSQNPWAKLNRLRSGGTVKDGSFSLPPSFRILLPLWYTLFLRFYEEELTKLELSGVLDPNQKLRISQSPIIGNEHYALALISRSLKIQPEKWLYLYFYIYTVGLGKIYQDLIEKGPEAAAKEALILLLTPLKPSLCLIPDLYRFPTILKDPFRPPALNLVGPDAKKTIRQFLLNTAQAATHGTLGYSQPLLLLSPEFRNRAVHSAQQAVVQADDAFKALMGMLLALCDEDLVGPLVQMVGEMIDDSALWEIIEFEGFFLVAYRTKEGVRIERVLLPPMNAYLTEIIRTIFEIVTEIVDGKDETFALKNLGNPSQEPTPEADAILSQMNMNGTKLIASQGTMTKRRGEVQQFSISMWSLGKTSGTPSLPERFSVGTHSQLSYQDLMTKLKELRTGEDPQNFLAKGDTSLQGLQSNLEVNTNSPFAQKPPSLSQNLKSLFAAPGTSRLYVSENGKNIVMAAVIPPQEIDARPNVLKTNKSAGHTLLVVVAVKRS